MDKHIIQLMFHNYQKKYEDILDNTHSNILTFKSYRIFVKTEKLFLEIVEELNQITVLIDSYNDRVYTTYLTKDVQCFIDRIQYFDNLPLKTNISEIFHSSKLETPKDIYTLIKNYIKIHKTRCSIVLNMNKDQSFRTMVKYVKTIDDIKHNGKNRSIIFSLEYDFDTETWVWHCSDRDTYISYMDMKRLGETGPKLMLDIIKSELISRSCHPDRILQWNEDFCEDYPDFYQAECDKWKLI